MSSWSVFESLGHPEVFLVLAVLVGLVLGSFYTVCISRTVARLRWDDEHTNEPRPATSILWPPSHCPQCRVPLRARELVPVLSYLALRGRCAHCHAAIPLGYPLLELLSGCLAGLFALHYGASGAFLVCLGFSGLLIVASGIDLGTFRLPDVLTLGAVLPAMLCAVMFLDLSWKESLLGAALGGGIFWSVGVAFKKLRNIDGLGMGDVNLMLLIGALCGPLALPGIVIAAGLSALLAFPFFLKYGSADTSLSPREVPIPFGPFLSFGALLHLLFGTQLLHWWLG
ncbi:MAG: prepilin peptidase [Bilophila sp.]